MDALAAGLQELGVSGVARRHSLYLAGGVLGPKKLASEHEMRRAAGVPSRFLDASCCGVNLASHGQLPSLQRKLSRLLPQINLRWNTPGPGKTTTGLPIIAKVPGMSHCWVALGYGGNGTTYAMIAADVIAGAITGRLDVDADLYTFQIKKRTT